jgi:hypothetical protein
MCERKDCFEATGRCVAALQKYSSNQPREAAMARFLINRVWEPMDEAELQKMGGVSKRLIDERFSDLVWEHSHVVTDDDGQVRSFCVYSASSMQRIKDHSAVLGCHRIDSIFEIAGDVSPADYAS